jgi:hypothetical protein
MMSAETTSVEQAIVSRQQEEKAKRLLAQLRGIIKHKNLDLKKIFNNFDISGDQEL